ncbi:hypothetical protein [Sphingomonas sp. Y38-1Y]|uniref:hypothetical protein n=1 Tax=Sphingomonas sp. Y38-1Y TaxID=3078265 RepID=UPI0028F016CA|nr:hypothetical protein [Sphingomonas sp. Y38-1Y]
MVFKLAGIALAVLAAQVTHTGPLVATAEDSAAMRMHVGDTGIRCVKLPCPSRGVFLPDRDGSPQKELLYADRDGKTPPPPMVGRPEVQAAVVRAWETRACLAIDARLIGGVDDRPVLRVDRIVGPCGGPEE